MVKTEKCQELASSLKKKKTIELLETEVFVLQLWSLFDHCTLQRKA